MKKLSITPPQTPGGRHCLVLRMQQLRAMRDAGELSSTKFDREYGAIATTLWGPDFFKKARAKMRDADQVSSGSV